MTEETRGTILVVDDDPENRHQLEMMLGCEGYSVESAADGEEALASLEKLDNEVTLVLLDVLMPKLNGIQTLQRIRTTNPSLPVIMLTGVTATSKVVEAMRCGASDYLLKPFSHRDLDSAIQRALAGRRVSEQQKQDAAQLENSYFHGAWCDQTVQLLLRQISASDVPVLIEGETGVGKEVVARRIHARSSRAAKPFLKLNCAALPSELVESELFGYERGAFTGALKNKPGRFEMADGGTILLDEIGDMDCKLQAKLLHVLQDQEFERLGGTERVRVNVRVLAATHCDLYRAMQEGRFREDLYYRLAVVVLRVPALRERKDEIVPLAEFLLRRHTPAGQTVQEIPPELQQALLAHSWPGNVRELENLMRKFIVVRNHRMLVAELGASATNHIRAAASAPPVSFASRRQMASRQPGDVEPPEAAPPPAKIQAGILEQLDQARMEAETEAILAALHETRWNRKQAAQLLNIDYKALLYKMRKLAIEGIPIQA
ncbi:MAG: sigma-54 dependent transcriptional regulator [Acidobacteriales bacterium]|nr:sigma-54 dependent transcriptional regulator [Terriglobales bacterium]